MERLTTKMGDMYIDASDNPYSTDRIVEKLGVFEDFMEEQGFESLEIVKRQCDLSVDILAMDSENAELKIANEKLWQENQILKDRWEKLKDWVKEFHADVVAVYPKTLLDKMQELEKGGK